MVYTDPNHLCDDDVIDSPCVGICQLSGDTCVGCLRTLDEVRDWVAMGAERRKDILAKLPDRQL